MNEIYCDQRTGRWCLCLIFEIVSRLIKDRSTLIWLQLNYSMQTMQSPVPVNEHLHITYPNFIRRKFCPIIATFRLNKRKKNYYSQPFLIVYICAMISTTDLQ
jgi:hypothetical protein